MESQVLDSLKLFDCIRSVVECSVLYKIFKNIRSMHVDMSNLNNVKNIVAGSLRVPGVGLSTQIKSILIKMPKLFLEV